MEKVTRCFMSVLLLSAVLSSALAEDKFFAEGGTLELGPNFSGDIQTVTWKLNSDMVAEWLASINDLSYYSTFKGRTTLDKETGTLNITNMSPADSGVYSVEINNMVLPERYNVKVIKEVPQPVVEVKPLTCAATSESCTLHCEIKSGEALTLAEVGPVTYSWKMEDREWMNGEKSRDITNDKETQGVETFSCRIKNPISEKPSDPIKNIFYNPNPADDSVGGSSAGPAIGGVLGALLVLVAGGAVGYVKREDIKKLFTKSGGDNKNNDVEQQQFLPKEGVNGDAGAASTEGAGGPDAASTEGAGGERVEASDAASKTGTDVTKL